MANWNACWPLMNVMIRYRWLNLQEERLLSTAKARKVHKNKVSKFEEFAAAIYKQRGLIYGALGWLLLVLPPARPLDESGSENVATSIFFKKEKNSKMIRITIQKNSLVPQFMNTYQLDIWGKKYTLEKWKF